MARELRYAREVFAALGGVVEVGAVNAAGTWVLADVSVGEFLERRRDDLGRLMDGIRSVCRFDEVAMGLVDELGWFRDYEVQAAHLLLWSRGVTFTPGLLDRLDEPPVVRRMCRMAADLQLTEFLQAVVTAAIEAGTEAGRRGDAEAGQGVETEVGHEAARIADVLAIACGLADRAGAVDPAQVFRMWRVAHLPRILDPRSDAPAYGKAGYRAYDEALEALLVGD